MQKNLSLILISIILGIVAYFLLNGYDGIKTGKSETEKKMCVYELDFSNSINILFIGGGQTSRNNMPEMIQCIAASQGITVDYEVVAVDGRTIKEHWANKIAFDAIYEKRWDFVVIQEASTWAIEPAIKEDFYKMLPLFLEEIKKVRSKPVFFGTYPREPDSIWYGAFRDIEDYQQMYDAIHYQYSILSDKFNVQLVPVYKYWNKALKQNNSKLLYDGDGMYPNMYGSYLTAIIFSKYLAGVDVNSTVWMPKDADVQKIQKLLEVL